MDYNKCSVCKKFVSMRKPKIDEEVLCDKCEMKKFGSVIEKFTEPEKEVKYNCPHCSGIQKTTERRFEFLSKTEDGLICKRCKSIRARARQLRIPFEFSFKATCEMTCIMWEEGRSNICITCGWAFPEKYNSCLTKAAHYNWKGWKVK